MRLPSLSLASVVHPAVSEGKAWSATALKAEGGGLGRAAGAAMAEFVGGAFAEAVEDLEGARRPGCSRQMVGDGVGRGVDGREDEL